MKIAFSRSSPRFWLLYFSLHFCFFMILVLLVRLLWTHVRDTYVIDFAEAAFEALIYALCITCFKLIRYRISQKQYKKNPVDRRRNNLFRE